MLEELAAPIVSRCREKCEETVRDSELQLGEIDHVLMVGGSSKIPCVRAMVEDYFGKKPSFIQDADQCVAIGAAIEGAIINGEIDRMQLLDVAPLALGVMTTGRVFDVIIEPNTTISTSRTIRYEAKNGAQKGVLDANFMMKNEYLSSKDVSGKQYYQTATGDISEGTVIMLREVDFGGITLRNVKASVVKKQKAPLLLGQSVLSRLGSIEIDNEKKVVKIRR